MGVATLVNLGRIDNIVTRTTGGVVAQKPQHLWTGGISVAARVASDKQLERRIEAVLKPSALADYFSLCDVASSTRCIDGRLLDGYMEDLALQSIPLGPQVPGGTAISALTRRIMHAEPMTNHITFTDDLDHVLTIFKRKGLAYGGHIDNHEHPEGNTGCGAVDRVPEILACIANPRAQRQIRGLTEKLLGVRYDDSAVDGLLGRIIHLQSVAAHYFNVDPKTGVYKYKQRVVEELQRQGDHVARLVGPHYEVGLVVNAMPGTTFDRDRFSVANNNQIQLFNYDFWFTQYVADKLYPVNHNVSYAVAKQNLRLQHEYILCRTLFAVAVALVLTDGSINLLIRK